MSKALRKYQKMMTRTIANRNKTVENLVKSSNFSVVIHSYFIKQIYLRRLKWKSMPNIISNSNILGTVVNTSTNLQSHIYITKQYSNIIYATVNIEYYVNYNIDCP